MVQPYRVLEFTPAPVPLPPGRGKCANAANGGDTPADDRERRGKFGGLAMKGLLLAAALLASTPVVAEIPSMKVSTWLGLSPDMRAMYIAGLWDGFKDQMPVHDARITPRVSTNVA